jgi:hypothetical protein
MKLGIIGGGAAGLMAAVSAYEVNPRAVIFILDKNDGWGKKVIISGGGRCNVTTGLPNIKTVLTKYPRGGKFLSSAMRLFPPAEVYAWFEKHGVALKIENDGRVFPVSDQGQDIVAVFEKIFQAPSFRTRLKTPVVEVTKTEHGFSLNLKNNSEPVLVDKLILTCGGQAYRQTGSSGDGYAFALNLGHTITPLAPSLSALTTKDSWPAEVAGLSLTKAKLTANHDKKLSTVGPCLFTHHGLSGPAVFALSSLIAFIPFNADHPLKLSLDALPDKSAAELMAEVEKFKTDNLKKSLVNALASLTAKSLAQILCQQLKLDGDKHSAEVSSHDLRLAVNWLKAIPLQITGRRAGDEFVTAGGVNLKEVDPKTMQSKICPDLYLAGEILDIDGFTGGFNLQAAWCTGRLAGQNAAQANG